MSQLTDRNILDELFSRFSSRYVAFWTSSMGHLLHVMSRYEDILREQVEVLCEIYWTTTTRDLLQPKIDRIAKGESPHAARALTLLLLKIPLRPHSPSPDSVAIDSTPGSSKLGKKGKWNVAGTLPLVKGYECILTLSVPSQQQQ